MVAEAAQKYCFPLGTDMAEKQETRQQQQQPASGRLVKVYHLLSSYLNIRCGPRTPLPFLICPLTCLLTQSRRLLVGSFSMFPSLALHEVIETLQHEFGVHIVGIEAQGLFE